MLNKKIFLALVFFLLVVSVQAETQIKLADLDSNGNLKSLDIITTKETEYRLSALFGEKEGSKAFLFPEGTRIQKFENSDDFIITINKQGLAKVKDTGYDVDAKSTFSLGKDGIIKKASLNVPANNTAYNFNGKYFRANKGDKVVYDNGIVDVISSSNLFGISLDGKNFQKITKISGKIDTRGDNALLDGQFSTVFNGKDVSINGKALLSKDYIINQKGIVTFDKQIEVYSEDTKVYFDGRDVSKETGKAISFGTMKNIDTGTDVNYLQSANGVGTRRKSAAGYSFDYQGKDGTIAKAILDEDNLFDISNDKAKVGEEVCKLRKDIDSKGASTDFSIIKEADGLHIQGDPKKTTTGSNMYIKLGDDYASISKNGALLIGNFAKLSSETSSDELSTIKSRLDYGNAFWALEGANKNKELLTGRLIAAGFTFEDGVPQVKGPIYSRDTLDLLNQYNDELVSFEKNFIKTQILDAKRRGEDTLGLEGRLLYLDTQDSIIKGDYNSAIDNYKKFISKLKGNEELLSSNSEILTGLMSERLLHDKASFNAVVESNRLNQLANLDNTRRWQAGELTKERIDELSTQRAKVQAGKVVALLDRYDKDIDEASDLLFDLRSKLTDSEKIKEIESIILDLEEQRTIGRATIYLKSGESVLAEGAINAISDQNKRNALHAQNFLVSGQITKAYDAASKLPADMAEQVRISLDSAAIRMVMENVQHDKDTLDKLAKEKFSLSWTDRTNINLFSAAASVLRTKEVTTGYDASSAYDWGSRIILQARTKNGLTWDQINNLNQEQVAQIYGIDSSTEDGKKLSQLMHESLKFTLATNEDLKKLSSSPSSGSFNFQTGKGYVDKSILESNWVDNVGFFLSSPEMIAMYATPFAAARAARFMPGTASESLFTGLGTQLSQVARPAFWNALRETTEFTTNAPLSIFSAGRIKSALTDEFEAAGSSSVRMSASDSLLSSARKFADGKSTILKINYAGRENIISVTNGVKKKMDEMAAFGDVLQRETTGFVKMTKTKGKDGDIYVIHDILEPDPNNMIFFKTDNDYESFISFVRNRDFNEFRSMDIYKAFDEPTLKAVTGDNPALHAKILAKDSLSESERNEFILGLTKKMKTVDAISSPQGVAITRHFSERAQSLGYMGTIHNHPPRPEMGKLDKYPSIRDIYTAKPGDVPYIVLTRYESEGKMVSSATTYFGGITSAQAVSSRKVLKDIIKTDQDAAKYLDFMNKLHNGAFSDYKPNKEEILRLIDSESNKIFLTATGFEAYKRSGKIETAINTMNKALVKSYEKGNANKVLVKAEEKFAQYSVK